MSIAEMFCFLFIWETTIMTYLFYKQDPVKLHTMIIIQLMTVKFKTSTNEVETLGRGRGCCLTPLSTIVKPLDVECAY